MLQLVSQKARDRNLETRKGPKMDIHVETGVVYRLQGEKRVMVDSLEEEM